MNTYTLEEVRQKAGGRRQKERKGEKRKGFFITLLSGHDITYSAARKQQATGNRQQATAHLGE
ncbi:MAG: hypothetical protein F6K54_23010 [Okeania sp. SIO3B5]|uniref:hypothetical protein n=1 Tax=Okeania sp. SIO3B5 TaxID=2607811 RepID=UPI0013FF4924|nr:hypothetical protein [Okeania sp. SIO3B5]NEO55684.1 hypothetical protein [Okeania sp. SIO3B5]